MRARPSIDTVLAGGGEMGALCRAFDWSATPLGPVDRWSGSLRALAGAVLNSRNPMLLFWGPDLIQLYNDAFRPSLGAPTGPAARHPRALGARGREFWTDVWDVVGPQIEGVMQRGESVWFEDIYLPIERNGRMDDVWWTYSYSPVRDDDGTIGGTLVVCLETTQRVLAEQRLKESARQLEARTREAENANAAKSQFLAVMSHELRTPLNAIGGYAELLALGVRGPVTSAQLEDLERIRRSQRHLLGLINEVLNYARLEAGAVTYDLGDVVVCDALHGAEGLVAPQARLKGLALSVWPCPDTLMVRADVEKLRQVLVNLLSNAVKYTSAGHIEVEVAWDERIISITVRDTGVGIANDKLDSIFEPFVQVGRTLHTPDEGTGLGLAISRDLARGMGGDLTVASVVGRGSSFMLALPRSA